MKVIDSIFRYGVLWVLLVIALMSKLWFPVLSDSWPHGEVAAKYGILRSDGVTERALFVIDKKGIIQYVDVHDINKRPPLENLVKELEKVGK